MAEQDPNIPQVTDPTTVADLVRLLQIRGAIGVLNVADIVLPVVSLGSLVTPTVEVLQPAFRSTDVFSEGVQVGAPANTVHADTGALPAGTYNLMIAGPMQQHAAETRRWEIQHRNAANTANLMLWDLVMIGGTNGVVFPATPLGYDLEENERLRIVNGQAISVGNDSVATIFARIR